jgi:hypothetical protein
MRMRHLVCLIALSAGTCMAQSSYMGVTPGTSRRADVEKKLGQPARSEGRVSEYHALAGSEVASIVAQYCTDSEVAERIEVYFPSPIDRTALMRTLSLPEKPETAKVAEGKLLEYYGSPQWLVLTYTTAKQTDGIGNLGYYTPDLFNSVLGKPGASEAAGSGHGPLSETTVPPSRGGDSTPSPYTGPSSGTIIWSGKTAVDGIITIEGDHSATGSIQGGLPGLPVQLDLDTREFAIVEALCPATAGSGFPSAASISVT